MTDAVRTLAAGYGYPAPVEALLEALVAAVREHLAPLGVRSLLLLGSAARGELTWLPTADGGVDLLSDIDAAVVTARRDPVHEARLRRALGELSHRHAKNPLFHVDAGVHRLYMKRHTIWTYEARMTGVTLLGEDVRWRLPRVTPDSLDLGALAELVLVRLYNQLLYTPLGLVLGDASPYERLLFTYVTCRNALELPTILLPHLGVLRPGYAARDEWLLAHPEAAVGFGSDLAPFCHEALTVKRAPRADADPAPRLLTLVGFYARLLASLARRADDEAPDTGHVAPADTAFDKGITEAFREDPVMRWRRRALELRLRTTRLLAGDVAGAAGYDRARATRFLLATHEALAHRLAGDDGRATAALGEATALAAKLGGARAPAPPSGATFAATWQTLREWFVALHGDVLYKGSRDKIASAVALTRWRPTAS